MESIKQTRSLSKQSSVVSEVSVNTDQIPQPSFQFEMARRQEPLAPLYRQSPEAAWVGDDAFAGTTGEYLKDPLHSKVSIAGFDIPVGVHKAVGGEGDDPVPGEILSASLAACLESTIRIIANRLNVALTFLAVTARAEADVRGTLRFNREVPIGFQKISVGVDISVAEGTSDGLFSALLKAAETSCVVMQTLRHPPAIDVNISRCELADRKGAESHDQA